MSSEKVQEEEEEGFEPVDVRSRIAALNGQNQTQTQKIDATSTQKVSPGNGKEKINKDTNKSPHDQNDGPGLDVKGLTALYGKNTLQSISPARSSDDRDSLLSVSKNGNDAESPSLLDKIKQDGSNNHLPPPAIPSRPVIQSKNGAPPPPPARPQISIDRSGPPQLPPRIREATTSRSETPTSVISDKGDADELNGSPVPYLPRRPQVAQPTNDLNGQISYVAREKPPRREMANSSSSKSVGTNKVAPNLPPRGQISKSADAIRETNSTNNVSRTSRLPNSRAQPKSPVLKKDLGPVVPPPRHIDVIRAPPKAGIRSDQSRVNFKSHQQFKRKRSRRRDEHDQIVYVVQPDAEDEQRYARLFEHQIALQAQRGGSAKALQQDTIVLLWRRSKLDANFLQKVYEKASGDEKDVHLTAFIKAMAAIDGELARRKR